LNTTHDIKLIKQAQKSNHAAFNELMGLWQHRIHRFAYRFFANTDDADEITQKTFISVYQKLDTLSDPVKFPAWIYRIANNLCLDELKRTGRKKFTALENHEVHSGENGTPAGYLENKELGEVLQKALLLLPDEQRTVIILKEYEGLKFREIAEILDQPENTVKSRMYHGLKSLRRILKNWNIQSEYLNYD
jgi:RNA polymerase sigma-70 factor, ECF subfamily